MEKKSINKAKLQEFLTSLPDETNFNYLLEIGHFAAEHYDIKTIDLLKQILGEKPEDSAVNYAAFYTLFMVYRVTKNYFNCGQLIKGCHRLLESGKHPTSFDPILTWTVESGSPCDSDALLKDAYKHSCYFSKQNHPHAGYVHAFPYYYVTIYERVDQPSKERLFEKWGQKALKSINSAIRLFKDHPTYYATKGRVLASFGQYDEARSLIRYSIQKTSSSSPSFPISLSTYQYYDLLVLTEKRDREFYEAFGHKNRIEAIPQATKDILQQVNLYDSDDLPYAFISYSHQDSAFVFSMVRKLADLGYRIWLDTNLEFGEDFTKRIVHKINHCAQFVYIMSAHSEESDYCSREAMFAINKHKKLLPIHIDQTPITDGSLFQFGCNHILTHPQDNLEFDDIAKSILVGIGTTPKFKSDKQS